MKPPPTAAPARPARPEVVTRGPVSARPAWIERATSADHKVVAQMFMATALVFLALAATEFLLLRLQLLLPDNSFLEPEIFNRLLTASVSSFVVLFALPFALGLIGYLVPLQIGARGTALPRVGQLAYWLYLAGALTITGSFLYAVPETGSIGLAPLSDLSFSPSNGADAWIVGTGLAVLGFVLFAINMVTTVQRLRAPGVAWRRLPLFSWAGTVVSYLLLIVGPALLAALVMLEIDRRFDGVFFDAGEGGAPLLYEHLAYIFLTGAYLIVFLTAAGVVSEILPTFARKPIFSHRAVAASFVAVAVLGLFAWMQNMYVAPLNEGWTIAAMLFALALIVPIGLIFYNWIATLWGGTLRLRAPVWYALIAFSTMACGLAGELAYSVIPVGWALANTTASQGDTLYLLFGGAVIGGFAALHYWFPKISGRLLGEGIGMIALGLMFAGIHIYVLAMFLAGLEGQPVDVYKYYEGTGLTGLNVIATLGAVVLVLGVLLELANAAYSWGNGILARGHDPWAGSTLEWFALSPPPAHNFDAIPDVRSTEPLRDIRDAISRRSADFVVPAPLVTLESEAAGEEESEDVGTPEPAEATGEEAAGTPEPAPTEASRPDSDAPEATGEDSSESMGDGASESGEPRAEEAEAEAQPDVPAGEQPQTPEADPATEDAADRSDDPTNPPR